MQEVLSDFKVAMLAGDFDTAERMGLGELDSQGEVAFWLNQMGQLYVLQGRFAESLQYFDRAVCADPTNIEALLNGVIVLSDLGFYEEAAKRFEAARALDGKQENEDKCGLSVLKKVADMHAQVGGLYAELGSWARAEQELTNAIEVFDSGSLRLKLSKVLLQIGHVKRALEQAEKGVAIEPQNAQLHILKAQCYLKLGQVRDASEAIATAEELDPRSSLLPTLKSALPL